MPATTERPFSAAKRKTTVVVETNPARTASYDQEIYGIALRMAQEQRTALNKRLNRASPWRRLAMKLGLK